MSGRLRSWLGRTITRKFTLLLAGFLVLQATMLVVGVTGVLHLGEEGGFINEAGRQRYRTVLIAIRAEEALAGKSGTEVTQLRGEMDAHFERFRNFLDADRKIEGMAFPGAHHEALREAVAEAEGIWQKELRPLVVAFEGAPPPAARKALARYKALAPQQVARLETIVTMLERDVRANTFGLARFSAVLLAASLALGVLGFVMVRREVSSPLRRLTDAAREIAAGAYAQRVALQSRDELGELAAAFNQMAQTVQARTGRIEALTQIASGLTSSLSMSEVLDQIMYHGISVSGATAACVAFYDEQAGRFADWTTQGLSPHFVKNMAFRPGGLADEAFTSGIFVLSNDRPQTRHQLSKLAREEGLRCFICLPLTGHSTRLGVIYFYRSDRDTFDDDEIKVLRGFAHLAAGTIENARLHERVENEARTDALTGLNNRREFEARLAEEHARARRYGKPYALMLLDLDHFKRVNDNYGHAAGDAVLRQLAGILREQLRESDIPARYGGEEFVIILPEVSGPGARIVGERIRRAVSAKSFRLADGREIGCTISIGASCFPDCSADTARLIETADQALYTAKASGRNRVFLYRDILKAQIEKDPGLIVRLLTESDDNIGPIVTAIAGKSTFFRGHMQLVEQTALRLASALKLSAEDTRALRQASLLHDIGMAAVPDAILNKTSALNPEELAEVRRHSKYAAEWLEQVPALKHLAPIVRAHHERYDGTGYPDGLKGEEIPYLGRVLAAADVYASMTADWIGHRGKGPEAARLELTEVAGRQLDPGIARTLLNCLSEAR